MKQKIFLMTIGMLIFALLFGAYGSTAADSEKTAVQALWENFETPQDEYKSRPIWFWNDADLSVMTKDQIREIMVKSKEESGYGGFAILPFWVNGYLDSRYMELYEYALQTAKELGVKMCLYDENGFPSGNAGGLFANEYPSDTAKRLEKIEKDSSGNEQVILPLPDGTYRQYLGAVAMNTDTYETVDISDKVIFAGEDIPGVFASGSHAAIPPEYFTPDRAFDGNNATRWNAAENEYADQWLEVCFDAPKAVDKVIVREAYGRVISHKVQYFADGEWCDAAVGTTIGTQKLIAFASVTATRWRLLMSGDVAVQPNSPTIYEIELWNGDTKHLTPISGAQVDRIEYDVPQGNWKIMAFATVKDGITLVDYLDESAVDKFIDQTYGAYYSKFGEYFGDVIDTAFYDEPAMNYAQGGRMWTGKFNELFEEKNGYNPITLYPSLWHDMGDKTASARHSLMTFRSELFATKYIKNMNDWCEAHGLKLTGHILQEENPSPVSMSGDLMKVFEHQAIPGVDEIFSYDAARSSFKIVSSAANNWDKGLVMTESYGGMGENMGASIMYKEMLNQFAKGINFVVPHAIWHNDKQRVDYPPELSYRNPLYGPELAKYNDFVSRSSSLLQNSRHVADIGVLYPIDNLAADFAFNKGDLYNGTAPEETDYTNIGELIYGTARLDFTYLHPDVIKTKCMVEGSLLKLNNEKNYENYKVIVMPGAKVISLDVLKKFETFYNAGGKVIATSQLPFMASEAGKDAEVLSIIMNMFDITEAQIKAGNPRKYSASSTYNDSYSASKAFDGVAAETSRWNAQDGTTGNQWLRVDFAEAETVSRVILKENPPYRVSGYRIEYLEDNIWKTCASGIDIGETKEIAFDAVQTKALRFYVTTATHCVSIREFEIYGGSDKNLALPPEEKHENKSASGGKAVYLGRNYMDTLPEMLNEYVDNFDVEIDNVETTGGDLSYIHKVKDDVDIYYFANSSDNSVSTYVNINKALKNPMLWNPHDGTKKAAEYRINGDITRIKLDISAVSSVFIVGEDEIIGDVDGNGKVETQDLLMLREYILRISDLNTSEKERADVNKDSKITIIDIIRIRNIILK